MNQFDEIRNQIDIECQIYLNADDVAFKEKEKAMLKQEEMNKEVGRFQRRCLSNLETLQCDQTGIEDLEQRFSTLDLKDSEALLKLQKDLNYALLQRQKLIFMSQGFVFLNKSYCERLLKVETDSDEESDEDQDTDEGLKEDLDLL